MEIRKNIIKADIDYQELDNLFDFYLIETDKKKYPSARLLDVPFAEGKILAVQYTYGNSLIVMLKKSDNNKSIIKSIIDKYNDENDRCLTFKQLHLPVEPKFEYSLVQILFNSLAKRSKDNFSNLGGRFYYFCKKVSKQIVCIELKLSKNCVLSLNTTTFTKAEKDNKGKKYVLQPNNTFRPITEQDTAETYTIFQYKNKKNVVPFLDTTIVTKKEGIKIDIKESVNKYFDTSKIGILRKILNRFHKEYGNIVKISFVQESGWESIAPESAVITKKRHLERLKNAFNGKTICIVDTVENDRSNELSNMLIKSLKTFFGDKTVVKPDNQIINQNFTIRIIHNKAYFDANTDLNDNYAVYTDSAVQNITVEDFSLKGSDSITANCIVILNELLVKNDLINTKKISLTDWNYQKDWTFCLADTNESDELSDFSMMTIKPNGSFTIEHLSDQTECENIKNVFLSGKKFRGIIINDKGEINIIQDSELFMMPNYEAIYSYFEAKRTSLRTKALREQCYLGCVDIHYKEEQNIGYYSSGIIGNGMDAKIEKATRIRNILPCDNSPLFFQEVIDTMNVSFVKNGQLTVLPFPFKYLREYAKMVKKEN